MSQAALPAGGPVQDHPQATTILILGILGLALCQVLGIVSTSLSG